VNVPCATFETSTSPVNDEPVVYSCLNTFKSTWRVKAMPKHVL